MKTRHLLNKLAKLYPKKYAEQFHDYVGLQVGKLKADTNRILLCLDFDEELMNEAIKFQPDLIITHHPFIYGTFKKVLTSDPQKKELVNNILKNNLCIYSYHTNFDFGDRGMNDKLASLLGLENIYKATKYPMMRIGYLKEEMDVFEFAKFAKKSLCVDYGLLIHEGPNKIKKVGIIGGGGSYEYIYAKEEGCDIYISGDVSHHLRREMVRYHQNYLDLPHEIEKAFMPQMYEILKEIDSSLDIKIIDHEKLPKVI